jgi:hypothetical protein
VSAVHVVLGFCIVGAFAVMMLWGALLWLVKRGAGPWFWHLLAVVQVVLGLQVVAGIVLIVLRGPEARPILHYAYGALFPILVLVIAHGVARDMQRDQHVVFAVAGLICFGLTLRALMTGFGID